MSLKERILYIQQNEGLTSSKFADMLGVQRSGLSHIYSGRNKPSIDFIEKLLSKYPKYNANWLITGIGEPKTNSTIPKSKSIDNSTQKTIFDTVKSEDPVKYGSPTKKELQNTIVDNGINNIPEQIIYIFADGTFKIHSNRDK